jgi:SIR2-like domain
MITTPTVLILGAGASRDYGFPTGRELLLQILEGCQAGQKLRNFLLDKMGFDETGVDLFSEALRYSGAPSVDLFLENRKNFEEIGKCAIAATLIPYEKYDSFAAQKAPRWYETIFTLMVEGGKFEENQLSVLTFNYDRSLEAFFFLALKNLRGLDDEKATEQLSKIKIVHLHGALGTKLRSEGTERGYQPQLKLDWIREAAKQIKIVHEIKPGKEFETAFKLLVWAEEIIFLGFGFHPVNVQRLRLQGAFEVHQSLANANEQQWLACRFKMGDGEVQRAKAYLEGLDIQFANPEWDIDTYLKNTGCLIPRGVEHKTTKYSEPKIVRNLNSDTEFEND